MTVTQKKMTIDEVMSISDAVLKESSKTLVLSEENFAVPTPDKSVDAKSIDTTETTSGGINRLFAYCKGGSFNIHIRAWGVVRLFHLLNKGNQVLFIIW